MRTLSLLGAAISLGFAAGVSAYVPTIGREATIGEDLNLTGFSGRVVGIDAESITLASQDQSHVTRLGQTLRESIKPVVN